MPTTGAYEFHLALLAVDGMVSDDNLERIAKGEWAWVDPTERLRSAGVEGTISYLSIYARCPDCEKLMTLWRRRAEGEPQGHTIDAGGNISPSVLHTWKMDGVEQCGFHTQPTRLLGFVDLRMTR